MYVRNTWLRGCRGTQPLFPPDSACLPSCPVCCALWDLCLLLPTGFQQRSPIHPLCLGLPGSGCRSVSSLDPHSNSASDIRVVTWRLSQTSAARFLPCVSSPISSRICYSSADMYFRCVVWHRCIHSLAALLLGMPPNPHFFLQSRGSCSVLAGLDGPHRAAAGQYPASGSPHTVHSQPSGEG